MEMPVTNYSHCQQVSQFMLYSVLLFIVSIHLKRSKLKFCLLALHLLQNAQKQCESGYNKAAVKYEFWYDEVECQNIPGEPEKSPHF